MTNIGVHINDINELDNYTNINYVQFFIDPFKDQYKKIPDILKKNKINCIIHSSYSVNLAKTWDESSWWVNYLISEIKIADIIGAHAIVIHTGKYMSNRINVSLNNMYSLLLYILDKTSSCSIKILLETPVGQGTELLSDFNEFINFTNKFKKFQRFGICLDTCHIFASGINIKDIKIFDKLIKNIDISKIIVIHLNDSKGICGCKKDRHEKIGKGYIGENGLRHIVKFAKTNNIIMILETPSLNRIDEINWVKNIFI